MALPASAQAQGSVSGIARNDEGAPLAGVKVEAVYQTVSAPRLPYGGRSIKAVGETGPDGRYSLSLAGLPPGEYSANAYQIIVNGGRRLQIDLVASDTATFGSHEAVRRDFRQEMVESSPELPYGNGGVFVIENAISDYTDLSEAEISLVPRRGARPITKRVRRTGEGLVVTGIPFGTYRVSARLGGRPLALRLWGPDIADRYAETVEHDFTMGALGNQFRVLARLPDG
ncbi:carboxypeptidase-like regulatory domain-containing protein [Enterovirga rhinocerotis]|uniref:Carboxypeptidase family protein n=1 Tax=Enterovirga rhinocerotis TaxID=1339210 RepID=A0A4R7C853_9HYPH|nr:carboxypeptidase-like regulatory domain-containing protein [Enterovirga rhinocerotis]TDR94618.1 hypothetical protein EV668_1906 [Enterovirga rhinocerotis]